MNLDLGGDSQNELQLKINIICNDHEGEFENKKFVDLCNTLDILYQR